MLTHQSLRSYTFRKRIVLRPFHLLVEKLLGAEATGPGTFYVERHAILTQALPPGASLLECGSGAGQMISYFTEDVGCRYVGSDISYGMVRDATREHPQLAFLQADALHLPFKDGSFDAVLAVMVLHHVEPASRGRVVDEMRRVARRAVFVQDLRSFDHPLVRAVYRLYYSLADGSYWRPTLSQWLQGFEPPPVSFTTTPARNISQRTCFFALPGRGRGAVREPPIAVGDPRTAHGYDPSVVPGSGRERFWRVDSASAKPPSTGSTGRDVILLRHT